MLRYTKTFAVGFCALLRAACLISEPSQSIGPSFAHSSFAFDQS
jgi:hypothetical protein